MTHPNDEASPIARLIGRDGRRTVGWVFVWETSELAILWLEPRETAEFVDPQVCSETLAKAKATTPVDLVSLLGALQIHAK